MPKHLRLIAVFVAALILMTGCKPQSVDTTTEGASVQFSPDTQQSTDASTDPSPDMTEESSSSGDPSEADTSDEASPSGTEDPTDADSSAGTEGNTEKDSSADEPTTEESSSESESATEPTETTPEETTREVLEFTPVEETVTVTASVNVRDYYSMEGNIITVLHRGDTVTRIGYHEKWSKIIYNGEEYYMSSPYLTTETLPPETTTEAPTTTTAAEQTTAPPVTVTAPPYDTAYWSNLSNVSFFGRWFAKEFNGYTHFSTLNAGSEFSFQTNGASHVFVYMSGYGSGNFYFAYSVDGQTPVRQSVGDPVIPVGGAGTHTVRIIIDSIGENGGRWNEETVVGISGISTDSGSISPWQYSGSVIAFYGDSITEGIRTLSTSGHSYTNSYTWYCSQAMGAIPIVCGFPGSGITTTGVFNTCTNAINYYSSSRGADDHNPSIIVLSHGTNDIHTDSGNFSDAYNQVLDLLHTKYPNAKIACMIPVSQAHADDIRNCASGKDWCGVVETSDWSVSYTDGIHPDASSSYSMGSNLASALRALFG